MKKLHAFWGDWASPPHHPHLLCCSPCLVGTWIRGCPVIQSWTRRVDGGCGDSDEVVMRLWRCINKPVTDPSPAQTGTGMSRVTIWSPAPAPVTRAGSQTRAHHYKPNLTAGSLSFVMGRFYDGVGLRGSS
jgi:hypothetical protein